MIKKMFGSVALLLISISLFSQDLIISGKVVDYHTGEPLTGAKIVHSTSGAEVITDFDGCFSISSAEKGIHTIKVSYVSYEEAKLNRVIVKEGESTQLQIKMHRVGSSAPVSSYMAENENRPQV
jgi:hypothetical protein